ncbi:MAG: sortase [Lachnospiraceae bacterium]|nr:sortase [Lachnospiraceae bacterium]
MRRRIASLFLALGTLMLLAAVALLAYNEWDNWRAGNSMVGILDALKQAEEESDADALPGQEDTQMNIVEVDGNAYIGTLSIERYGLELPVMSEWSYRGLKIAPGRYSGSARTDDLVICGHNYERHFRNLKNLNAGDEILFTDVNGNVFYYEVDEVIILQPTAVEEMLDGASEEWDLTLFTCTLGGQTRVTVRCSCVAVVKEE